MRQKQVQRFEDEEEEKDDNDDDEDEKEEFDLLGGQLLCVRSRCNASPENHGSGSL